MVGTLVSNIGLDSFNKAQADPRWSGTTASAIEIATANDDVACKVRVNLIGVEYAVVSDYQNAGIALSATKPERPDPRTGHVRGPGPARGAAGLLRPAAPGYGVRIRQRTG
jgi:hypothetical protein